MLTSCRVTISLTVMHDINYVQGRKLVSACSLCLAELLPTAPARAMRAYCQMQYRFPRTRKYAMTFSYHELST